MRNLLFVLAGLTAGVGAPKLAAPLFGESDEPPLQLELQIDGVTHQLVTGKKATLTIGDAKHEVLATVGSTRRFAAAGIEFDYPSGMGFEFEHDADIGLRIWTLDGNNVTTMVYRFDEGMPALMAKELLVASLGEMDVDAEPEKTSRKVGGADHVAWRATVPVMGSKMTFTSFGVTAGGGCCVVMVQDMLDDRGNSTAEAQLVMKQIAETFRVSEK